MTPLHFHRLKTGAAGPTHGFGPGERARALHGAILALAGTRAGAACLRRLLDGLDAGDNLTETLSSLATPDREAIEAFLGRERLAELTAIGVESDPELFYRQLLNFWRRGDGAGLEAAQVLGFAALAEISSNLMPADLRAQAIQERDARIGQGKAGPRAEYLLRHLTASATDARLILPMLGATLLGGLVKAGTLGRLLAGSEAAWYSRGLGARVGAGLAGFQAETLVFAAGRRLLDPGTAEPFAREWARAGLSLGVLKAAGVLTAGPLRQAGASALSRGLLEPGLPAAALFLGLTGAARLEMALGLRPRQGWDLLLADAAAGAIGLGAGMCLGQGLLGPRFGAFQRELRWRTEGASPVLPVRLPMPALANRAPHIFLSSALEPGLAGSGPQPRGEGRGQALRLPRKVVSSKGEEFPFTLIHETPPSFWSSESATLVGKTLTLAERDGLPMRARVEGHEVNRVGDPITPEGVLRVRFALEEGETRGKAFVYADREAITLYFIDLEETMITKGPPMRPGAGSIFFTWLAEQAALEGKRFNVTRITSPQTVKILLKQNLMDLERSRVEACNRIDPESYGEEYRVAATFALGDREGWGLHRRQTDFFNVFGVAPSERK